MPSKWIVYSCYMNYMFELHCSCLWTLEDILCFVINLQEKKHRKESHRERSSRDKQKKRSKRSDSSYSSASEGWKITNVASYASTIVSEGTAEMGHADISSAYVWYLPISQSKSIPKIFTKHLFVSNWLVEKYLCTVQLTLLVTEMGKVSSIGVETYTRD